MNGPAAADPLECDARYAPPTSSSRRSNTASNRADYTSADADSRPFVTVRPLCSTGQNSRWPPRWRRRSVRAGRCWPAGACGSPGLMGFRGRAAAVADADAAAGVADVGAGEPDHHRVPRSGGACPYNVKFLWAPLMDRFAPLGLGRRRGWLVIAQLSLAASIAALGLQDPTERLWAVALAALVVAFFSATQDVVIDAYRRESLADAEQGLGASMYTYALPPGDAGGVRRRPCPGRSGWLPRGVFRHGGRSCSRWSRSPCWRRSRAGARSGRRHSRRPSSGRSRSSSAAGRRCRTAPSPCWRSSSSTSSATTSPAT